MAKNPNSSDTPESEVWNAIGVFEQILEAMPDDRASLEALAHAYEQIGDRTKAKEYSVRLLRLALGEGELDVASALSDKWRPYASEDIELKELIERTEAARQTQAVAEETPAASLGDGALAGEAPQESVSRRSASSISEELALAWHLLQNNELSQEEYAKTVHDLTEMSAAANAGTISLLHVLHARGSPHMGRIMVFMSKDCRAPIIALSGFEARQEAASLLQLPFMIRRGAMVFEVMGKHALVVAMNPCDKQLRKDIQQATGKECHFFMCTPADFDAVVERLKNTKTE